MTYYQTVINAATMGEATDADARRYAAWLQARLERDYPEANIDVRASESAAQITRTDDDEDEESMQNITNRLFSEWLALEAARPLNAPTMLIISGEGTGEGMIERYEGKREPSAIRSRLSRERSHGDKWAEVWIELEGLEDAGYPGAKVYGKLGRDLNEIVGQRAIPASVIRDNPAAQLAAGHKRPWAAASGAKGGRPRKSAE